jgi:thymidylate synthase
MNKIVKAKTADDAWLKWYEYLKNQNTLQSSRDGDVVGEEINAITVIDDPTRCIMKNKIRRMPIRYAIGEFIWYLSGNKNLKPIQLYTDNWDRMSDDGTSVNSNYGYCIKEKYGFDQLDFVYNKLKNDRNSRQAVIHIKDASDKESKDINCTVCIQFFIRDGKLYMTVYMRSNDLWLGFPFDVFQFANLQVLLAMKLECGLGSYTHIDGSLHLYKRDLDVALKNELENGIK